MSSSSAKSMSIIITKGTLDWAYPPFILATTGASMGLDVSLFFTFYGLVLCKKKLDLSITTLGNAAMEMPALGRHVKMPNIIGMLPGASRLTTTIMQDMIGKKGIASIEELRDLAREADVRMIACQMTMDLFEYQTSDMLDGIEYAGAATYIETASRCDINLFI